ncbi:MAG: diguanylate cyclase [Gammaproteobacteria bacterium]
MAGQRGGMEQPGILVVDPSKVSLVAARKLLEPHFSVYLAEEVEAAWELLSSISDICAVFTEQNLPGSEANALLQRVRSADDERIADLPVIVITSGERKETERRSAMEAGATDFILKPFDAVDLLTRARAWGDTSQNAASLRQHNNVLRTLVMVDPDTRAGNRDYLLQEIVKDRSFTSRHGGHHSLLYITIDNYERILREQGRVAAREAVALVADVIRSKCRREDTFARVGDSEFALSLLQTGQIGARVLAERIRQAISLKLFKPKGMAMTVTASIGVSVPSMEVDLTAEQILDATARAAKQAARAGGNQTFVPPEVAGRASTEPGNRPEKRSTAPGMSGSLLGGLDVAAATTHANDFIEELLPVLQALSEADRLNLIDRLLVMAESSTET